MGKRLIRVFSPACLLFLKSRWLLGWAANDNVHVYDLYRSFPCPQLSLPVIHSLHKHCHRPASHCIFALDILPYDMLRPCVYLCYSSQLLFAKVYSRISVLDIEMMFSVCVSFVIITVLFCLYVFATCIYCLFTHQGICSEAWKTMWGDRYNYQKLNINKIQVNTTGDYNLLFLYTSCSPTIIGLYFRKCHCILISLLYFKGRKFLRFNDLLKGSFTITIYYSICPTKK